MATSPIPPASKTTTVVTQQPRTYQEMLNYMLPTKVMDGQTYVPRITTNDPKDPNQLNDFDHWHGAGGKNPHTHVGGDYGYSQLNTTTGKVDYRSTTHAANQNVSVGAPVGGVLTIVRGSSTYKMTVIDQSEARSTYLRSLLDELQPKQKQDEDAAAATRELAGDELLELMDATQ